MNYQTLTIDNAIINQLERERLLAVQRYQLSNVSNLRSLEDLVQMVARVCDTPVAYISLIGQDKQVFVAQTGLGFENADKGESFCADTINQNELVVIKDAALHPKYASNPYVKGEPNVRFYAGMPIKTNQGQNIGTLCVIDKKPRELSIYQLETLRMLTSHIIYLMELRIALNLVNEQKTIIRSDSMLMEKYYAQNSQLKSLAQVLSHQISGPVASIKGLMYLINSLPVEESGQYLPLVSLVLDQMDEAVKSVTASAFAAVE